MMENRSFDNMLGWLKRINPEIEGLTGNETNPHDTSDPDSPLEPVHDQQPYTVPRDLDHSVPGVAFQAFGQYPLPDPLPPVAPMNGFAESYIQTGEDPFFAMGGFLPEAVPIHTTLALEFAVLDHWYCSVPGPTAPNRFYLHTATSDGSAEWDIPRLVIGYPQKSIYESLQDEGYTWKNYFQEVPSTLLLKWHRSQEIWNYAHYTQFLVDAANGDLPNLAFIDPRYFDWPDAPQNDDHPGNADVRMGQHVLKEIYEAIRAGPLWQQTAFLITYDEHGGFYDHVGTPYGVPNPDGLIDEEEDFDFTRLGPRVPTLLASPWVNRGVVEHRPPGPYPNSEYEHSSLPATIKYLFGLASPFLTARDEWAGSFHHLFNRTTPRLDTPLTLPEVPPFKQLESSWKAPISSLQKEFVQLAASLTGDSVTGDGMNEIQASLYIKVQVDKFFGKCMHSGADAHTNCLPGDDSICYY